jgi:hypothetical protein
MRSLTSCLIVCSTIVSVVHGLQSCCAAEDKIDFNSQIRPLLAKHCYACHGSDVAEGGVRFDQRESVIKEADSGNTPIVPGDIDTSELLRRISSADESERMPPEGDRLKEDSVAILKRWIEQGAEYSKHWSFQPISDPEIPLVADASATIRNPIDAFVFSKLQRKGLAPNASADSRTLLRRLYYGTIGLPPTASDVDAFAESANRGDAEFDIEYELQVDRMLSDPGLGQRWGRHWLDLVRYAETNSFERDGNKPNAWRYRDYVVASFNDDKPYDQFVREQLAGDELDLVTRDTLIATGYYRLGIWDDEPADPEQAIFDGYDDLVTVTGQGFLGLTLNCARCHDHKIDPIKQRDYYSMVAFFRDVTPYGYRSDEVTNSQIDLAPNQTAERKRQITEGINELNKKKYAIEQEAVQKMDAPDQRATEGPERETVLVRLLDRFMPQERKPEYQDVKARIDALNRQLNSLPPSDGALGLATCEVTPPQTHILLRGSPHAPGDVVNPEFISLLNEQAGLTPDIKPREKSSGRRRALADWIVSENNWLTARVIVNRVWQHHFGRGIVRSSNNFGQLGDMPTHPELLDYLAMELMRHDWNLKPIHRMILTSQTYRLSSADQAMGLSVDPRNDLFWRFDPRRLSAEELRDSMLAITGQLNAQIGGPSFFPDVSDEVKAGQSVPGKGWEESSDSEKARRSIYIFIKRSLIPPELSVFDFPETDGTCEARFLTTQAAQSLNLLNGRFSRQCADILAAKTWAAGDRDVLAPENEMLLHQMIGQAVELAYQRPSTANDYSVAVTLLQKLKNKHQIERGAAWKMYALVLLNTNEFLYLD